MSESLETTLTNSRDDKVNIVDEDAMLEGLAGEFFGDEPKETLPEQDTENMIEGNSEEDETELLDMETNNGEEYEEEDDALEDDDESLPEDEVEEDSDEIDMTFEVPVKIDGVESKVTMEELVRGYQTAQHANKKSIEASDMIKKAESLSLETNKLKEQNAKLLASQVDGDEQQLEAYDRKIKQLIEEDDMFELPKWQEARRTKAKELAVKKEEATRLKGEADSAKSKAEEESLTSVRAKAIETLNKDLPNWQESYESVVNWAVKDLGFGDFANITDPKTIALMYDYKALKDGQKSAIKKRKKVPTRSVRAAKPASRKARNNVKTRQLRSKVLKGKASESQEQSFLDSIADSLLN